MLAVLKSLEREFGRRRGGAGNAGSSTSTSSAWAAANGAAPSSMSRIVWRTRAELRDGPAGDDHAGWRLSGHLTAQHFAHRLACPPREALKRSYLMLSFNRLRLHVRPAVLPLDTVDQHHARACSAHPSPSRAAGARRRRGKASSRCRFRPSPLNCGRAHSRYRTFPGRPCPVHFERSSGRARTGNHHRVMRARGPQQLSPE